MSSKEIRGEEWVLQVREIIKVSEQQIATMSEFVELSDIAINIVSNIKEDILNSGIETQLEELKSLTQRLNDCYSKMHKKKGNPKKIPYLTIVIPTKPTTKPPSGTVELPAKR